MFNFLLSISLILFSYLPIFNIPKIPIQNEESSGISKREYYMDTYFSSDVEIPNKTIQIIEDGEEYLYTPDLYFDNHDGSITLLNGDTYYSGEYSFLPVNTRRIYEGSYFDTSELRISFNSLSESDFNTAKTTFENLVKYYHILFDRHYGYFDDENHRITNLKSINDIYGTDTTIEIPYELYDILVESLEISTLTNSYYNIAIGQLSDLWSKYNFINSVLVSYPTWNATPLPTASQISRALTCTPTASQLASILHLTENNQHYYVEFDALQGCEDQVVLSLGASGKGYMVERVKEIFVYNNYGIGFVDGGTSSYSFFGDYPVTAIGVNFPESSYIATVFAQFQYQGAFSISTSADNRNFFLREKCGSTGNEQCYGAGGYKLKNITEQEIYHHIIDPYQGKPLNINRSITLIADDAFYLDAVSTALFNLSALQGMEILDNLKTKTGNISFLYISNYKVKTQTFDVYMSNNFYDSIAINSSYKDKVNCFVYENNNFNQVTVAIIPKDNKQLGIIIGSIVVTILIILGLIFGILQRIKEKKGASKDG